jgi:hypothetical protein
VLAFFATGLRLLIAYLPEVGLLALVLAIYLFRLGSFGVEHPYEIAMLEAVQRWLPTNAPYLEAFNGLNQIISPWLQGLLALWLKLVTPSLYSARLLFLLIGVAGLAFFHQLTKTLFPGRMPALLATLCLAGSWGFYHDARLATGETVWWLVELLAFGLFWHWYQENRRRIKLMNRSGTLLQVLFMGLLALLTLAAGWVGPALVVLPIAVFLLWPRSPGEPLANLSWKPLVWGGLGFFLLAKLVWVHSFGILLPITPVGWHEEGWWEAPARMIFRLVADLFPWTFIAVAAFIDMLGENRQVRKFTAETTPAIRFVTSWTLCSILIYLIMPFFNVYVPTLVIWPPILMLVGAYLASWMDRGKPSLAYGIASDATVFLLLSLAVATSWLIFAELPDVFPLQSWFYGGTPYLSELTFHGKTIPLQGVFPLWKVWLVPIPLLLLLGGLIQFILNLIGRSNWGSVLLIGWSLLFVGYFGGINLPLLVRPIERHAAQQVLALSRHGDIQPTLGILDTRQRLFQIPFYFSRRLHRPERIAFFNRTDAFARWLEGRALAGELAVLDERDYFSLPAEDRLRLRIRFSEPRWTYSWFWRRALETWTEPRPEALPDSRSQHKRHPQVLLVEVLPKEPLLLPEEAPVPPEPQKKTQSGSRGGRNNKVDASPVDASSGDV